MTNDKEIGTPLSRHLNAVGLALSLIAMSLLLAAVVLESWQLFLGCVGVWLVHLGVLLFFWRREW
jgi:hypothetical protein